MNEKLTEKNIALISTRPYEKNIDLLKKLKNKNVLLLNHPLTEIKPLQNYAKFDLILSNLNNYQHIIFISTNAVNFFATRLKILQIKLPKNIIYSSIGPKTKEVLKNNFNINVYCPNEDYDSEHLIKNKIFNKLQGKKILIVRGTNGREALKSILEDKGAEVDYGECYIRNYLKIKQKKLNEEIKNCSSIFLLISSYNSAIHFEESAKKWMSARKIKFIVNHKKIDSLLQNSNYKNLIDKVIVTNDLSEKSLLDLIQKN